jgi:chaperonin GroEL
MDKEVKYGKEVRTELIKGVNMICNPVKSTLGAKGRLVAIFDSLRGLHVTKDGFTVAKSIRNDSNKLQSIAINIVMQAIDNTNTTVGDATTTTAIFCQHLVNEGFSAINNGHEPLELIKGIEQALAHVTSEIKLRSVPVEDKIAEIAKISGNNRDDIGEILNQAFLTAGTHEESSIKCYLTEDEKTTVDFQTGYKIERGFLRDNYINDPSGKCVYRDPYILMVHAKLNSFRDFMPLLEKCVKAERPLVIIADKFEGEFLNSLSVTMQQQIKQLEAKGGGYFQQIGVIQNPMALQSADEMYGDISAIVGSKGSHLTTIINDVQLSDLGSAKEVIISRSNSFIIGGAGDQDKVDAKIAKLKIQQDDDDELTPFQKSVIKGRIESLSGTHATIRVGGANEAERLELKDLYDDALSAVRAALKEGIVCGGGTALLRISKQMIKDGFVKKERWFRRVSSNQKGWNIMQEAISQPFKKVISNAGLDPELIQDSIMNQQFNVGYDVLSNKIVNMIDEGIIDPAMAERVALENAVSVATLMYNMDGAVVEKLG